MVTVSFFLLVAALVIMLFTTVANLRREQKERMWYLYDRIRDGDARFEQLLLALRDRTAQQDDAIAALRERVRRLESQLPKSVYRN